MTMLASQITSLMVVYSIVYSGVNQRKHQSSASLAFVREIHRGPVNFPHKWPVTRKMFPFDDVIMHIGSKTLVTINGALASPNCYRTVDHMKLHCKCMKICIWYHVIQSRMALLKWWWFHFSNIIKTKPHNDHHPSLYVSIMTFNCDITRSYRQNGNDINWWS